jgi:ribosome biogenesis protein UTP30
VQSLSIKSSKSASLPIWTCKLGNDEGARWHGLTLEAEDGNDSESDELTSAETPRTTIPDKATEKPVQGGKKQKRAAEVAEPPAQKKPKKAPSEPTTMGSVTSPKPRKGSKVRICLGAEPYRRLTKIKPNPLPNQTDIEKAAPSLTKDALTKDELKQKRRSGEKKKEKLVKGNAGTVTAKKSLIGRKAR